MKSGNLALLWKWSMRDMRERWAQVVGISLIIALGVAVFSGLGSSAYWRIESFGESYARLNMYDLKVELTAGSCLNAEELTQAVRTIPHADWIEDAEARLSVRTSVDASTAGRPLVVSGELIGVDLVEGGPSINKLHLTAGRSLEAQDQGAPVCIVEQNFADYHNLEPGDRLLRVAGGKALEPVGTAISAEHMMVIEEESGVLGAMAQDRFAALFVPLETAQALAGLPGMANQVLITVPEGVEEAGLEQLQTELEQTLGNAFPEVGISTEKGTENRAYRALYDDITSDQEMFNTFSFLLLLAAAFGAFVLIGRMVDAQRREIGISMALGVPPLRIARRYVVIGVQIALLGTALGVALALLINQPLGQLMTDFLPLPYFRTSFQPQVFVRGALIGVLIPFLAILFPIWRAVRVAPVDAIQTGYLVSKGGGLAPLLSRVPLPGSSFALFPVRNLSRGLRRTAVTVLGLAIAVAVLIAWNSMLDSFRATIDIGQREVEQDAPHRTLIALADLTPLSDPLVSGIVSDDRIAQTVPSVVLPGRLVGAQSFDVLIQLIDLDNDLWTPTIVRGSTRSEGPGILITEKAARDLGVDVGDTVTLVHPFRESAHAWRLTQTPVQIMGVHPDILRFTVYMDSEHMALMNLKGVTNLLQVDPTAGVEPEALRQALAQTEGVVSVRRASAAGDAFEQFLSQYVGLFVIIQSVVLVMAFLIAFNTTRTNVDERRRDLATMFAFGTRVRTALRMAVVENLITGVLGTALGIGLGWLLLNTMLLAQFERDAPEMNTLVTVSPATYGWAVLIGVIVVAVTPLLMSRRLTRMDIPSTLRVVE